MRKNRHVGHHSIPMLDAFEYFRPIWSPRASYHLARLYWGDKIAQGTPHQRLYGIAELAVSALWLMANRVPTTGEAYGFKGYAK